MKEKNEISKKRQLLFIGSSIILLFLASILLTSSFEDLSNTRIKIIILFGILLFIITLFTKSQFVLKVIDYVKIIFITLCFFTILTTYFILPTITDGISMESTIHDGDILLCTYPDDYKVGDIVVVYLEEENIELCKRIVGSSGDNVYLLDNEYYLNGVKIDEDYIDYTLHEKSISNDFMLDDVCYVSGEKDKEYELNCSNGIPTDYYLVLGDNRDVSADSRIYGLFYKDDILAKVVFDVNQFKRLD